MYNYNNTINHFDKLYEKNVDKKEFMIPQHLNRLLTKLKTLDNNANVNHILRLSANYIKHDQDLKNVFEYFKWNEEKRIFETDIKMEDAVRKIESTYEIKSGQSLNEGQLNEENESLQVNRKGSLNSSNFTLNKGNSNLANRIYDSMNEEMNFTQNRNGKILI
jgi:hypothetical protein